MSTPHNEQQPNNPSGPGQEAGTEGQAQERTFNQAEVDRIIADRLKREDVKGLKAKAAELDKIAEAQQTAEQRAAKAQQESEERAGKAEALAIRYRVAAAKKISLEDADLFLTGGDEGTITAQADRLLERDADRQKQGNYVPSEGKTPTNSGKDDPMRETARKLFKRED